MTQDSSFEFFIERTPGSLGRIVEHSRQSETHKFNTYGTPDPSLRGRRTNQLIEFVIASSRGTLGRFAERSRYDATPTTCEAQVGHQTFR